MKALSSYYNTLPADSFRKALIWSGSVHVAVFLFFIIRMAYFTSGETLIYERAAKVDIVALPDKFPHHHVEPEPEPPKPASPVPKMEEPPAPPPPVKEAEPVKKIEKKDPEAINLKSNQKKQQEALKKIQQMKEREAIAKIKNQQAFQKRLAEAKKLIKGNQLSSGNDLSGLAKLQHEAYISSLEKHIRQNWALPEWLSSKNLKAQVRVRVDEHGQLVSRELVRSSGNSTFDDLALQTVERSAPMPPPPEKFIKLLKNDGILLGFPE